MKIKETKILQDKRLDEICESKNINYDSLKTLLESVKTKKLFIVTILLVATILIFFLVINYL